MASSVACNCASVNDCVEDDGVDRSRRNRADGGGLRAIKQRHPGDPLAFARGGATGGADIAGEQKRAIAGSAHGQLTYGHVGGRPAVRPPVLISQVSRNVPLPEAPTVN